MRTLIAIVLLLFGLATGHCTSTSRTLSLTRIVPADQVRVRTHENLEVEYRVGSEGWVTEVISRVDAARRIVARVAKEPLLFRIYVTLAPSRKDFVALSGKWAEHSAAIARGETQEIVVNGEALASSSAASLEPVLVHEFTHLYLDARCAAPVPRWLHEGIALHVADEWTVDDAAAVYIARIMNRLIPLRDLERGFPQQPDRQRLAYRQSYSLVSFLASEVPGQSVTDVIASIRGPDGAHQLSLYTSPMYREAIEFRWQRSLRAPWNFSLIFLSTGALWGLAILLTFLAWYARRARAKKLHGQWAEEDSEEADVHPDELLDPMEHHEQFGVEDGTAEEKRR